YNDPSFGYIGMESLFKKAKALNKNITKDDVRKWYASNIEVARFQKERPKFKGFKIASDNPNSWQIDLAFWMKKRGQRPSEGGRAPLQPILTAVNINSRIGYAQLLDNKRAKTVLDAVKSFVKTNKVEIVTSDNGSEFMNKSIQRFFKDKNIDHYNNEPGDHQTMGKIERFNRTLKQRIIRLPNRDNIDNKLLQKLIQNYNR
ncbi:hypothetical protein C7G80_19290, partial [Acinetobacter nosocomialis]|uniref:DDE-type integrase/transposase/recombinase n=1 Tax=Acinetobacter nosocomialis TaxID=106654 RepID=UPI000D402253